MEHYNDSSPKMVKRANELQSKLKTKTAGNISKELSQVANGVYFSETKQVFDELKRLGETLKAVRTWDGAIVPGAGKCQSIVLADDTLTSFKPQAGQCLRIPYLHVENQGPANASTVTISYTDGTTSSQIYSASVAAQAHVYVEFDGAPINLNNSIYLTVVQSRDDQPMVIDFPYFYTVYDGGDEPTQS